MSDPTIDICSRAKGWRTLQLPMPPRLAAVQSKRRSNYIIKFKSLNFVISRAPSNDVLAIE